MAAVTTLQLSKRQRRIDPIAAAWGGLVGGIGLVVAGPRELALRVAIVMIVGVIAGFLTGVRAIRHRIANAWVAWMLANLFYWAFVLAAHILHTLSARRAPPLYFPGGVRTWAIVTVMSLIATLVGAAVANTLLRPASRRSNYS
jgi:hypothetical protein